MLIWPLPLLHSHWTRQCHPRQEQVTRLPKPRSTPHEVRTPTGLRLQSPTGLRVELPPTTVGGAEEYRRGPAPFLARAERAARCSISPEGSAPGPMSVYSDLPSSCSADHLSDWSWFPILGSPLYGSVQRWHIQYRSSGDQLLGRRYLPLVYELRRTVPLGLKPLG